jgi:ribosomal protein S14
MLTKEFTLRSPCPRCGSSRGLIKETGAQDCVYCFDCGTFCYNAPRAETGKPVRHVRTRAGIKPKQRARIIMRANTRCELCGSSKDLHVGHLLSVDAARHEGMTEAEINSDDNLAAMCDACNLGVGNEPVPLRLAIAIAMARAKRLREVMK